MHAVLRENRRCSASAHYCKGEAMNRYLPVEGSDLHTIEPVNNVFRVAGIIRSHLQLISITWEVDNPTGSGSTECEAWRGQYELDSLIRAGYRVLNVTIV
jgi:hypothetical protein